MRPLGNCLWRRMSLGLLPCASWFCTTRTRHTATPLGHSLSGMARGLPMHEAEEHIRYGVDISVYSALLFCRQRRPCRGEVMRRWAIAAQPWSAQVKAKSVCLFKTTTTRTVKFHLFQASISLASYRDFVHRFSSFPPPFTAALATTTPHFLLIVLVATVAIPSSLLGQHPE